MENENTVLGKVIMDQFLEAREILCCCKPNEDYGCGCRCQTLAELAQHRMDLLEYWKAKALGNPGSAGQNGEERGSG
jgi:hypothetical protein